MAATSVAPLVIASARNSENVMPLMPERSNDMKSKHYNSPSSMFQLPASQSYSSLGRKASQII